MEDMYSKLVQTGDRVNISNKELALLLAAELEKTGAKDIKVLEMTGLADWCDYLLIATSTSNTQSQSCLREVANLMAEHGVDGGSAKYARADESGWLLLDGGTIVVHLFNEEVRAFYNLEGRWVNAPIINET